MLPVFAVALLLYFWFVQVDNMKLFYLFTCAIALFSFSGMANYITEAMLKPNDDYLAPSSLGLPVQWLCILLGMTLFLFLFSKRLTWIIDHFHERSVWRTALAFSHNHCCLQHLYGTERILHHACGPDFSDFPFY